LMDFLESSVTASGLVRIELGSALDGLPDGMYVATLRSLSSTAESPRSAPTESFKVTGLADRPSPKGLGIPIPSTSSRQVSPGSSTSTNADSDKGVQWKLWSVVGITMATSIAMLFVRERRRCQSSDLRRRTVSTSRRDRIH